MIGIVYLIHFDQPYKHARHYLGFCENDLDQRVYRHQRGQGSRLMAVIAGAGITWNVVKTWTGDRHFERRLKNRGGAARICPTCAERRTNAAAPTS